MKLISLIIMLFILIMNISSVSATGNFIWADLNGYITMDDYPTASSGTEVITFWKYFTPSYGTPMDQMNMIHVGNGAICWQYQQTIRDYTVTVTSGSYYGAASSTGSILLPDDGWYYVTETINWDAQTATLEITGGTGIIEWTNIGVSYNGGILFQNDGGTAIDDYQSSLSGGTDFNGLMAWSLYSGGIVDDGSVSGYSQAPAVPVGNNYFLWDNTGYLESTIPTEVFGTETITFSKYYKSNEEWSSAFMGANNMGFYCEPDGLLKQGFGGGVGTIQLPELDTWYDITVDIDWDAGTGTVTVDGVPGSIVYSALSPNGGTFGWNGYGAIDNYESSVFGLEDFNGYTVTDPLWNGEIDDGTSSGFPQLADTPNPGLTGKFVYDDGVVIISAIPTDGSNVETITFSKYFVDDSANWLENSGLGFYTMGINVIVGFGDGTGTITLPEINKWYNVTIVADWFMGTGADLTIEGVAGSLHWNSVGMGGGDFFKFDGGTAIDDYKSIISGSVVNSEDFEGYNVDDAAWSGIIQDGTGSIPPSPSATESTPPPNNLPSIPQVNMQSDYHSGSRTITWMISTDDDEDPITYNVKVGTSSGASDVLSQTGIMSTESNSFNLVPTNTYYYSVRAYDGIGYSDWYTEQSFTFTNQVPFMTSNTIIPLTAYTNNILNVNSVTGDDPDSDSVSFVYQWYEDNILMSGRTTNSLSNTYTIKNKAYKLGVTPTDTWSSGSQTFSNEITVLNTPPVMDSNTNYTVYAPIYINNLGTDVWYDEGGAGVGWDPIWEEVLVYDIGEMPDSNLKIHFHLSRLGSANTLVGAQIYRNGIAVGTQRSTSLAYPAFVEYTQTIGGWNDDDLIQIYGFGKDPLDAYAFVSNFSIFGNIIENYDDYYTGAVINDNVSIANTTENFTLANHSGADIDGDTVLFLYQWYENNIFMPGQTSNTLTSENTVTGQSYKVEITPTDTFEGGTPVFSNEVQIESNSPPFISTWNTALTSTGSSASNQIKLPLTSNGEYDFIVNWGDGSFDNITSYNQAEVTHTYLSQGIYEIKIYNIIKGIGFTFENTDSLKLLDISQWGNLNVGNDGGYFAYCKNFDSTATDALNLTGTTNLESMFMGAYSFNGNINNWDTSQVTDMGALFSFATNFNQPLDNWDTSNVTDMHRMFNGADVDGYRTKFNQSLNAWNISKVTDISMMFSDTESFNHPLDNWDTSNVISMFNLFDGALAFTQDISMWDITSVTSMGGIFSNFQLSTVNYDNLLISWSAQSVQSNIFFSVTPTQYTWKSINERAILTDTYNWIITDGGMVPEPNVFISRWNTSLNSTGSSNSNQIKLPLEETGIYNFIVYWGDGSNDTITAWNQAEVTHTYSSSNEYDIVILGDIIGFRFNNNGDKQKLLDISQWGNLNVGNNNSYFAGCSNFNPTATDALDLNGTTDLSNMFFQAKSFNGNINNWDTSNVIDMSGMFYYASSFNQSLSSWNTSNVNTMDYMFSYADTFDINISSWDVSNVINMSYMFYNASSFNQNLSTWNISSVTDMTSMFEYVKLSSANYDSLLIGWNSLPYLQNTVSFHGGDSKYTIGANLSRQNIIDTYSWTIIDGGYDTPPNINFLNNIIDIFISSVNWIFEKIIATDIEGIDQIIIFLYNSTYDLINITNSFLSPTSYNFTGLDDGVYYLNATVNDTVGNLNQTSTKTIIIDTIKPSIEFVAPTEDNNTYIDNDYTYINTTLTDTNNITAFIDWNNSLVGWWRFNNESGENNTFFRDWSSYNNDGVCTKCPIFGLGKLGQGLLFDVSTGITIKDNSSLDISDSITLSAWVKVSNAGGLYDNWGYKKPIYIQDTRDKWWNNSWIKRKAILINTTTDLTDYQLNYSVIWISSMDINFNDLRFIYFNETTDTNIELPYWIESNYSQYNATIWLKANLTTGNNTIYMYYGNSLVSSTSKYTNTFKILGNGADGNLNLSSGLFNINIDASNGRTDADAINFKVSGTSTSDLLYSGSTNINLSVSPTGLSVNDEILIINLQGISTDYSTVGNYETKIITAISDKTITIDTPLSMNYSNASTQKIMVQRVPNYINVTISSGATFTANAWDGIMGGVLFFRANNTVNISGNVDMRAKGYHNGRYSMDDRFCRDNVATENGESISGPSSISVSNNVGASGGISAVTSIVFVESRFAISSAGHSSAGQMGNIADGRTPGAPGTAYGDNNLSKIFLGSGTGGGFMCIGGDFEPYFVDNEVHSGGIIYLASNIIFVNGTISTSALNGIGWEYGGSSGGSIYIKANSVNIGTNLVTSIGGEHISYEFTNYGSDGRIRIDYYDVLSGSTNPINYNATKNIAQDRKYSINETIILETFSEDTYITDYQIMVDYINTSELYTNGKLQQDCNDTRFTWYNQNLGLEETIDFWTENCDTINNNSTFWIKIPEIYAGLDNNTIYMYYGNPTANSIDKDLIDYNVNFASNSTAIASSQHSAPYAPLKSIDNITNNIDDTAWLANPIIGSWLNISFNQTRRVVNIGIKSAYSSANGWCGFKNTSYDLGGSITYYELPNNMDSLDLYSHNVSPIDTTYLTLSPETIYDETQVWGGLVEVYIYGFKYTSSEPTMFSLGAEITNGISKGNAYAIIANTTTAFARINNNLITAPITPGWNYSQSDK